MQETSWHKLFFADREKRPTGNHQEFPQYSLSLSLICDLLENHREFLELCLSLSLSDLLTENNRKFPEVGGVAAHYPGKLAGGPPMRL